MSIILQGLGGPLLVTQGYGEAIVNWAIPYWEATEVLTTTDVFTLPNAVEVLS
jgi:hypothetical protein